MARTTRKPVSVPATEEPTVADTETQTQTMPEAQPQHGANATPAEMDAGHILDNLDKHADAIRAALSDADETQRGDVTGKAYTSAKVAIDHLDLTHDVFARWKPDSGDAIDKAIVVVHDTIKPEAGPAVHALRKSAMRLAVLASDKEKAEQARIGAGTAAKPQFNFVYTRTFPSATETDERVKGIQKQEEARPRLDKLIADHSDKDEKAIFQAAKDAVNDVDKLRRLGNDLSTVSMARSRWRKWLYVPLIVKHLDAFVAHNEGNKALGDVWVSALGKAQKAHTAVINKARLAGNDADADALRAAVEKEVWTDYLEPLTRIGKVIKVLSPEDEEKALLAKVDKLFALAEEVGRELNADIVDTIVREFSRPSYAQFEDVSELLGQTPKARKEKATAAKRREKEATETAMQEQTQQTANTVADAAKQQRQADRTAARQNGQAPAASTPTPTTPQRRTVARQPNAAKSDDDDATARLAKLKPTA